MTEMKSFFKIDDKNGKNDDDYVIWIFGNVRYMFDKTNSRR
jgi:hypothetical protein